MNCPKCKATVEHDSFFCKFCGTSIGASGGTQPATAPKPQPLTGEPVPTDINASRDPAQEKEIWTGRPSWRSCIGGLILWFLASLVALIAAWKYTEQGNIGRTIAVWTVIGVGVVLLIRRGLIVFGEYYRLTTQRLFVHHGILSRVTDQMELVRVDDVRLKQSLWDRIMNTGDLEVMGTDKTDQNVLMESINTPAEVAEHVRKQVRLVRSRGTLFVENV